MNAPKPTNATDTLRQARTWEKAQKIAEELAKGGEYTAYEQTPGVWGMYNRTNDASYIVDLTPALATCTCPDFDKHGNYCKHIWGLRARLEEDAQNAQMELFAEEEANAEAATGTDPFSRF